MRQQKRKRLNPPIRGSIVRSTTGKYYIELPYQSPYKGFNSILLQYITIVFLLYQSPYKGFNRDYKKVRQEQVCINPPIRGSIDERNKIKGVCKTYQSPYKGFNRKNFRNVSVKVARYQSPYKGFNRRTCSSVVIVCMPCINPPIRGSIEQDNALFRNYKHKR